MARPDIEITHFLLLVAPNRRRLGCLAARQKGPSTRRDQNYSRGQALCRNRYFRLLSALVLTRLWRNVFGVIGKSSCGMILGEIKDF
jgi:hypothetical protein